MGQVCAELDRVRTSLEELRQTKAAIERNLMCGCAAGCRLFAADAGRGGAGTERSDVQDLLPEQGVRTLGGC